MSADWIPYMRQGKQGPWSCMVDIQYRAEAAGDPARGSLLLCRVRFQDPGPDGVGTQEESERIDDAFERIQPQLESLNAVFVARTRRSGHSNFVLYSPEASATHLGKLLGRAFPGDTVSVEHRADPGWQAYRSLLPDLEEERMVLDLRVIQTLEEHGDPLTPERDIRHFAYFPSQTGAQGYAQELQKQGFSIQIGSSPGHPLPFSVRASHDGSVTIEAISPITLSLTRLAAAHSGEYDGWEAMLVGPGSQKKPGLFARLFGKSAD